MLANGATTASVVEHGTQLSRSMTPRHRWTLGTCLVVNRMITKYKTSSTKSPFLKSTNTLTQGLYATSTTRPHCRSFAFVDMTLVWSKKKCFLFFYKLFFLTWENEKDTLISFELTRSFFYFPNPWIEEKKKEGGRREKGNEEN